MEQKMRQSDVGTFSCLDNATWQDEGHFAGDEGSIGVTGTQGVSNTHTGSCMDA